MVKYALKHFRTLNIVLGITIDESAIDDFCDMMEWTREQFFNSTIKLEPECCATCVSSCKHPEPHLFWCDDYKNKFI